MISIRTVLYTVSIYNAVVVTAFLSQPTNKPSCPQTHLYMKNSHRARFEKNLEDMMGNDWRMFRAQLVAQEAAEKRKLKTVDNDNTASSAKRQSSKKIMKAFGEPEELADEKQAKQEKFGNIFAAIFSGNNSKEVDSESSRDESISSTVGQGKQLDRSIFEGHNIGGATPECTIPGACEDPFVSEAELPVLLKPRAQIDKHRWAHPLSHLEPGCVLIANEKLGGVFHQTVVLIIEHNEGAGSTGIVINR